MKRTKGQKKRVAKKPAARAPVQAVEWLTTKVGLRRKFCASQTTVDKWCARPDFPGGSKGPWNAETVAAWLELIESPLAPRRDGAAPAEERAAAVGGVILPPRRRTNKLAKRRLRAQVEKIEADAVGVRLRNDLAVGKLVDRELIVAEVSALVLRVKARITAWPEEVRMEIPAEVRNEVVGRLKTLADNLLREMARWKLSNDAAG